MANRLSTEQLLLLNNLMYAGAGGKGIVDENANYENVGDWINTINDAEIKGWDKMASFDEWKNIVNAVKMLIILLRSIRKKVIKILKMHIKRYLGGWKWMEIERMVFQIYLMG